jgi:molybdopterin molybdotransferase
MKEFFKVKNQNEIFEYISNFNSLEIEIIFITDSYDRILCEDILSDIDLPDFARSTMDGYAVKASSTYGASEGSPAYFNIKGRISMGSSPDFTIQAGEAAKIATGGMLPKGADSVVMIEHTDILDETTIECFKSGAPYQHVIQKGEDYKKGNIIISSGTKIRAQEAGLLAAFGKDKIKVFKKPIVGIISTGDEIVDINSPVTMGKVRDINSYTLAGLIKKAGGAPLLYGIIKDDYDALFEACKKGVSETDMLILSGGSSVGTRDYTIEVLSSLKNSKILAHGISISPGKPTILAEVMGKSVWGLPGHAVSAMVVFEVIVKPFLKRISGLKKYQDNIISKAYLTRNIASAQGRVDFVRVKLKKDNKNNILATPILGKSGLINTMVKADAFIKIEKNTEGLTKDETVEVYYF